jgi:2-(1,2-epoxy-1,2-dihydrophenyl)acetyl-CoA isomerase
MQACQEATMKEFESVNYSVVNSVATISLNRPAAMNSINRQLRQDLHAAITRANADDTIRVVVLAGEGRGFCAGADLAEDFKLHHEKVEQQIKQEYKPLLLAIHQSPKIYISSVNGAAAGIGSALAMVCDLTIMADNAYIYQAFAAIALVPDGGASWHLVNQLGYKRAFEMIVECEKMPAATCLELGLSNRVVAADTLPSATQAWAEKLSQGAPLAQAYIKQILKSVPGQSLAQTIDLEAELQNITTTSKDSIEGIAAFFEKRAPHFIGE